jgi:hypothetical protein
MNLRCALLWDNTQRLVVFMHRRFGTTYRFHLQRSRSPRRKVFFLYFLTLFLLGFLDPWRSDRYVVPKRRYRTTTQRCVIPQKSAHLIYIVAEARNHGNNVVSMWQLHPTCTILADLSIFHGTETEFGAHKIPHPWIPEPLPSAAKR